LNCMRDDTTRPSNKHQACDSIREGFAWSRSDGCPLSPPSSFKQARQRIALQRWYALLHYHAACPRLKLICSTPLFVTSRNNMSVHGHHHPKVPPHSWRDSRNRVPHSRSVK